jgi:DNA polymerase
MFPGQAFPLPQCAVAYVVRDDVLWCVLPSGRRLYYHRPRLTTGPDRLGRGVSYTLSVEQWNTNPLKGPMGWHRVELWVGILVENVVQAVARDLLAGAMVRCEPAGYPFVMHTHDEGTAEVPQGVGSVEGMAAIFAELPAWAEGWPVRAEGGRHVRYQKF